jgi:hypothetical protein
MKSRVKMPQEMVSPGTAGVANKTYKALLFYDLCENFVKFYQWSKVHVTNNNVGYFTADGQDKNVWFTIYWSDALDTIVVWTNKYPNFTLNPLNISEVEVSDELYELVFNGYMNLWGEYTNE